MTRPMRTAARSTDPDTSHEAAARVTADALKRRQREVLWAMRRCRYAITDDELVATYTKYPPPVPQSPQSIRSRRAELVVLGLVTKSGRAKSKLGNPCTLWALTSRGIELADAL